MCVSQLRGHVDGGTGWRSDQRKRSARPSRSSGYGVKQTQNGSAMKNQVCAPLFRPASPFPDLCCVDATPGVVEGAGATNDVSGEQLMEDRPVDAASPPPGSYWHRDA